MSEMVFFILSAVFMVLGLFAVAMAAFGVFKFRFVLNRMHAAALIDTLGMLCISLSLMFATHSMQFIPKLVLIVVLQWLGSPIASHFVGKLEVETDREVSSFARQEDDTVPVADAAKASKSVRAVKSAKATNAAKAIRTGKTTKSGRSGRKEHS